MRTFTDLRFCLSHSIDCVIYQNFGQTVCMRVWVFIFIFLLWLSLSLHLFTHSPTILFFSPFSPQFSIYAKCKWGNTVSSVMSACVSMHVRFHCRSGSAAVVYFIFQYSQCSIANLNAFHTLFTLPYLFFSFLFF